MTHIRGGESGQSHIFVVVLAGLAAAVIAGLVVSQDRLRAAASEQRSGEAAAQAAGAIVAEEHLALVRSLRDPDGRPRDPTPAELDAFLADPALAERALSAAREVALANRGPRPVRVQVVDLGEDLEVAVESGGRHRVSVRKVACCRR